MFSCFTPPVVAPTGNPASWSAKDVKAWAKASGLPKDAFSGISGQDLLAMKLTPAASGTKAATAVEQLQKEWVKSQATLGGPPSASKRPLGLSDVDIDVDDRRDDQTPRLEGGQTPRRLKAKGGAAANSSDVRQSMDSPLRKSIAANVIKNLSLSAQGPMDFADALRKYTPEESAKPVCDYIVGLGKCGKGLADALPSVAVIGRIFGEAYKLHGIASGAVVNVENVLKLDSMAQDVLRTLDLADVKQLSAKKRELQTVLSGLEEACALATPFTTDGWLLHMACNEGMKEEFDGLQNELVDTIKAADLEAPGKPLMRGDYRDATKAVRRTVKQFGSGNISQGLRSIGYNVESPAVQELARQLEVPTSVAAKELEALPRTSLPLEAYYAKMVQGNGAQGAAEQQHIYSAAFSWYDKDGSGAIEPHEFREVAASLNMLGERKGAEAELFLADSFRQADADGDGKLCYEEFAVWYDTIVTSGASQELRLALGAQKEVELKDLFARFASFGSRQVVEDMDSFHFSKLCKECSLVDDKLNTIEVDIIFSKCKPKGGRRLTFAQFLTALSLVADKKGSTLEHVATMVLATGGPVAHATKAESVRLHDDKSTYTGVYAKGGPKVTEKVLDLASMLDRSTMDAKRTPPPAPRGPSGKTMATVVERKAEPTQAMPHGLRTSMRLSTANPLNMQRSQSWQRRSAADGPGAPGEELYEMFCAFSTFGAGSAVASSVSGKMPAVEMDGAHWIKMLRECGLLDVKTFGTTAADLVFVKAKPKGMNKIDFAGFKAALQHVADAKGMEAKDLHAAITNSQGPLHTRTPVKDSGSHAT